MAATMMWLEGFAILITLILLYGAIFENRSRDEQSLAFLHCIWLVTVGLVSDFLAWLCEVSGGWGDGFWAYAVNFLAMSWGGLIASSYAFYGIAVINKSVRHSYSFARGALYFNLAALCVNIVTVFCGKLFTVDHGVTIPGPFYYTVLVCCLITIVFVFILVLINVKRINRHDARGLVVYAAIPLIGAIFEMIGVGVELAYLACTFGILAMYVLLQSAHITDLEERKRMLETISFTDALTGLGNRNAFTDKMDSLAPEKNVGLIFCDVNGLKRINDSQGHKAGDRLLMDFARLLRVYFPQDSLFRISGDEFVVVLPNHSASEFKTVAERLERALQDRGRLASMGASYGPGEEASPLLREAEEIMYRSKQRYHAEVNDRWV